MSDIKVQAQGVKYIITKINIIVKNQTTKILSWH